MAVHTLLIILIASVVLTFLLLWSLKYYLDIFHIDSHATSHATIYAIPLFLNSVTFIFIGGLTGILRDEGETKIPMIASSIGIILDALLDPLFINTLDMGVMGASGVWVGMFVGRTLTNILNFVFARYTINQMLHF